MLPVAQAYVVKCISRSSFIYALGRAIERRILLLETYRQTKKIYLVLTFELNLSL